MAQRSHKKSDLEKWWKMFEGAGYNACELSRQTRIPLATWRSRIRRAETELGKEQPPPSERRAPSHSITDAKALEVWKTYERNGYGLQKTALALGWKRSKLEKYIEHARVNLGKQPYGSDAKILLLDIETAPNKAYVWGTYKQNINPDWIEAAGYVLCWTAKWLGSDEVLFKRLHGKNHKMLLDPMHKLLHEAHAVITYNGIKFDLPTLNKEFLVHGFKPPSPYKQIDLLQTMWRVFLFPNNKLDYICKALELGEKLRHDGPQMWLDCMDGDEKAWEKMEEYNRRDVVLLEKLYKELLPWIKGHPNVGAITGVPSCPNCGSEDYKQDRTHLALVLKYKRYQCGDCGTWFRGNKTVTPRLGRDEERFRAAM